MKKFKTISPSTMMGTLTVLQKINSYETAVEIRVMREGLNQNKWDYRNLEKCYMTFAGRPILCAFPNGKIGDGHNSRERTNPDTGEKYDSFIDASSERIVGTLSDDVNDLSLVNEGGYTWLVAQGRLFTFYAPELVREIVRTGRMEVSAETSINDGYKDGDTEVFTDYFGLGVTILGHGVAPAIPGANIKALAALEEEFKNLKLRAASLKTQSEPDGSKTEPQGSETNNPEKRSGNKRMNKKALAELQTKFDALGYKVLGASDDGLHVCLMSADGAPCAYEYTSEEDKNAVVAERIKKVSVNAVYTFDGDVKADIDVCEITDGMAADLIKANADKEEAEKRAEDAEKICADMKEKENARRIEAAAAAVVTTLEKFNKNSDENVPEEEVEDICDAAKRGEFTECVDADGKWCGDEVVAEKVLARCAKSVMAKGAKRNNTFDWGAIQTAPADSDGVEGLLARINK